MQRLKEIRSETYERNITRIARVHALNRVANIMPKVYHFDTSGKLKPGQTIAEAKWAEVLACREVTGIHSMEQLLEVAASAGSGCKTQVAPTARNMPAMKRFGGCGR